jgi:nucleoside-diphosphate-sugar epimerase
MPSSLIKAARPTHLLHLAWCADPNDYLTNPANVSWTAATAELAEAFAASGGERFVGAGTCAEYGRSAVPCHERETALRPESLYGESKVAAFGQLSAVASDARLSFAWARIFSTYGPYQASERLIPAVILALLRGSPVDCTAGGQLRDFVHVQDTAAALIGMLQSDITGACNIGSGTGASVREIVMLLARTVGSGSPLRFGAKRLPFDEPAAMVADTRRLRDELGWRPRIALEEGLTSTVEWWRGQVAE